MFVTEGTLLVQPVRAAVVSCLASRAALDAMATPAGALALRIADDETMLLAGAGHEPAVVGSARHALDGLDPPALVVEVTDAWAIWSLQQPQADAAIARLTAVPVPRPQSGLFLAQGAVCGVTAKLVALPDRVCVMVSSTLSHHLRDRVMQLCADLHPRLQSAWTFAATTAGMPGVGR